MNTDRLLSIANRGQAIASTNYFDSEFAREGKFFLSWNAGAGRLLVPDSQKRVIAEMRTAKYVIVSQGPWAEDGGAPALELLFEDDSDAPFVLTICHLQTDRLLRSSGKGCGFYVSVWTRGGQKLCLAGRYREVASIPCLEEWATH